MEEPRHYEEVGTEKIQPFFLEESAYKKALEAFIVVCVDIALVNRETKTLYLGRRRSKPMDGRWWCLGGRLRAFEEARIGALRCLQREISLEVGINRFVFVSMRRYIFKNRQQEPQENPCDSLCYVYSLELSETELSSVVLSEKEYFPCLRPFRKEDLLEKDVPEPMRGLYMEIFEK